MTLLWYLAIIVFASLGISKSGSLIIAAITKIAQRFRISDFTLGFFILGIATSTPEIFISINAAIDNVPQLSLGNLLGGTIVLLSLVIGLTAVIRKKVSFRDTFTFQELLLTSFLLLSPVFLLIDGFVSRFDGLLLIVFYLVFFLIMNKKETLIEHIRDKLMSEPVNSVKLLGKFILGLAGLLLFSKIIVETAIVFANNLNIAPIVIGLLLLSIGTNLPELTLSIFSGNEHKGLAIGDFLGSACANVLILGTISVITPFPLTNYNKVLISLALLGLTVITFFVFARSKRVISRKEGLVLIFIYLVFVVSELLTNSLITHP